MVHFIRIYMQMLKGVDKVDIGTVSLIFYEFLYRDQNCVIIWHQ